MNPNTTPNPNGQLGQIVTWRVPAQVGIDKLRNALAAAALSPDLAGDLHPKNVLRRALADMKAGRVIAKLQDVDTDRVRFQLTRERVNGTAADYQREALVTLNLRTGIVESDEHGIEEQARALVREHTAKRLTSDISRLIQRLFDDRKADLIPIREQGGAYFVPDAQRALVDAIRTLLKEIGGNLASFAVKFGCAETAESIAESLADHLRGMVTELRDSCAGLTHETRGDVINRRTARITELRRRLANYAGLLGAYSGSIEGAINEAETALLAQVMRPTDLLASA